MLKTLLILSVIGGSICDPILFPHGWFESKNLRPRDAIYLNMMAQSNLEYGGVTLEELDHLDAVRKLIPRPSNLPRDREEDDKELDREPIIGADGTEVGVAPKDGEAKLIEKADKSIVSKDGEAKAIQKPEAGSNPKKSPFRRVELKMHKKREAKKSSEVPPAVDENPFEDIVTRSPPKDYLEIQRLRNRIHRKNRNKKKRKRNNAKRKNGFLTRDDIIKAKPTSEPSSVTLTDRTREKAEFERRNVAQETWEREAKMAEQIREEMMSKQQGNNGNMKKPEDSEPISPALKLADKEYAEQEARTGAGNKTPSGLKIQRLPNNPYRMVDIRKATVLTLPIPPEDEIV